jgi:aldose 1-epimerase
VIQQESQISGAGPIVMKRIGNLAKALIGVSLTLPGFTSSQVTTSTWGHTADGQAMHLYTLTSGAIEVKVTSYGARLVSIRTPDRSGIVADIVLGYDRPEDYLGDTKTRFGAVIGRYANRIARGHFSIDGKSFQIPPNDGPNALHGGPVGFDSYVWQAHQEPNGVEFSHVSPDGDMGFPGTLTVKVRYSLIGNALRLDYSASADRTTVLNLTNHVYFNLRGDDKGSILGERLQLNANRYLPTDSQQIPTGELSPVTGSPFDFREPTTIGAHINDANVQLQFGSGYDQSFVINGAAGTLRWAAIVTDSESGRKLTVETTEPGVQFYGANHLDGTIVGRHGVKYGKNAGFCLETQHFPDSPNHANFPSTILFPGKTFRSTTIFTFGATAF